MSFTCGIHGWRHAQSPCPSCEAMRNVPPEEAIMDAPVVWGSGEKAFRTYPRCPHHGRNEDPKCRACQLAETVIPDDEESK